MNQEIRKYLIDKCVIGKPIYYKDVANKLNLNMELDYDRSILSKTLGDISTYEFKNNRALISSIVIYKQENDHGNGFYKLCEQLGLGKSTTLKNNFLDSKKWNDLKFTGKMNHIINNFMNYLFLK